MNDFKMNDLANEVQGLFSSPQKKAKASAGQSEADQRQSQRVLVKWRMVLVRKNGERITGTIRDASLGGMCAHIERDLHDPEPVEVHVEITQPRLRSKQVITASCRIAYTLFCSTNHCVRVGLEIVSLSDAHRAIYDEELNMKLSVFGNGSLNAHVL